MPIAGDRSLWEPESFGATLLDTTIGAFLARQAARLPHHEAVVFPDLALRWTYADLHARTAALAAGLVAHGIGPGERVAVLAPNGPDWLLLEYALARIGAVLVTVNTASGPDELHWVLHQSRACCLFAAAGFRGTDFAATVAAARAAGLPELRTVAAIGPGCPPGWLPIGTIRAEPGDALDAREAAVLPGDVAQIQYTSGTTGRPKGVMLTHRGTLNNANLMAARGGFDETTRLLAVMPLFHTAGCVCNALGMLAAGGTYVGLEAFDAAAALRLLAAERITVMNGVPTMFLRLLAEPGVREGRHRAASTLRTCFAGGTAIPPAMLLAMREAFGAEPMVIMGMTECSPLITQTRHGDGWDRNSTSAGIPLPFTALKLVAPGTDDIVPLGTEGELCIRGFGVTPGYWEMPERTAETIDPGGWLHSGDLAVLDAEGRLRIVGRLKDMVIRGGENLYPAEIENMLMEHPAVDQAQVVGVPDPELGEALFAFLVLRPGTALDGPALRDWARARFSRHKVPRHFAFVPAFPLTANGKVQKFALREQARGLLGT